MTMAVSNYLSLINGKWIGNVILGKSGGVDWMHLAQDRDQWWVLVNMVMNVWLP